MELTYEFFYGRLETMLNKNKKFLYSLRTHLYYVMKIVSL